MKNDSLPRMILSLGVITIIAGALLAAVYTFTSEPIAQAEKSAQLAAVKSVAPEFDTMGEPVILTDKSGHKMTIFPLTLKGKEVGAAIESYSMAGFSGEISVMVGLGNDGTITGYEVLKQGETPGLGAKMNDWFRDPKGHRSVIGLKTSTPLTVAKDGGEIDGITAATISSRAFLDAVNRAAECYSNYSHER